uniref:(northern house mosquito) hypothetical protein n=1 Tax=Culex pipiens TaxID=7175 RepID=A0A8D8MPZ6_CULPI
MVRSLAEKEREICQSACQLLELRKLRTRVLFPEPQNENYASDYFRSNLRRKHRRGEKKKAMDANLKSFPSASSRSRTCFDSDMLKWCVPSACHDFRRSHSTVHRRLL